MKPFNALLAALLVFPLSNVHAAYQTFPVKTRELIIENGARRFQLTRPPYGFRVEVLSDAEGPMNETLRRGRPFVMARSQERYAVRLYNPLPVRVAVNLTSDGLNSIPRNPTCLSHLPQS